MADQLLQNVYDTVRHNLTDPIPIDVAASYYQSEEFKVNCFTISSQESGERIQFIQKRPGMVPVAGIDFSTVLGAVTAAPCANAVMTSLNDVYVACLYDSTNGKHVVIQYRPITGTTTKVGEITGTSSRDTVFLTELTIANVCTLGLVWNSFTGTTSKGYYATSGAAGFAAASLTEIVDVDFPPKRGTPLPLVGGMVQMNGTTYVMTNTGEIANSDLNSITSWNSLGTIQAISYPDQGVGLCRYKHHLVAFGEDSIEFFNDVGLPAPKSPLARTDQAFIKFGALTAKAILPVDDTVYFIAKSGSGTVGLHRLDGYVPVKVSTAREDVVFGTSASQPDIFTTCLLSCVTMFGTKHVTLGGFSMTPTMTNLETSPLNHTIAMYSIQENEWWAFQTTNQNLAETLLSVSQYQLNNNTADWQYLLIGPSAGALLSDAKYIKIYQIATGTLAQWEDKYGNDAGSTAFNVFLQTNKLWWGTEKRKRIHRLKVLMDGSYGTAATLNIRYAKEILTSAGGTVFTRTVTFPNTQQRYYISNLGQGRCWQFMLWIANDGPLRFRALEFDISQAAS